MSANLVVQSQSARRTGTSAVTREIGVHHVGATALTREQVELVKRTIAKDATDDELALFIQQCNRTGLDPFAKQIYAIKRWDKAANREVMAVQVGIDGFRLIAQRTGEYAGQTPAEWCGADGVWRDVWLSDEPPLAARVGVLRRGFAAPLYGVATLAEYRQTTREGALTKFWRQLGPTMLAKCAESQSLRRAFPLELSGLYTPEESASMHEDRPAPAALPPRDEVVSVLKVPGSSTHFVGHGGMLIEDVPDDVLRQVIAWVEKDPKRIQKHAILRGGCEEILLRRASVEDVATATPDVEAA